jgi:hypothetical protein
VVIPSTRVVFGSFDRSDVVEALEGNGFERDSKYSGYTLLTSERAAGTDIGLKWGAEAIAVRDGTVVATRGNELASLRGQTKTVIDTSEGEADRYVEASDEIALLSDELGGGLVRYVSGFWMTIPSHTVSGAVASGQVTGVDGETGETTFALVSREGADINFDELEEWTRQGPEFDALGDLTFSLGGNDRTVTVTGQGPTADLIGAAPRRPVETTPTASFSYEYDQTAGELTIQHRGGDTLAPEQISFDGNGLKRASWANTDPSVERITVGDEVTLTGVDQDFLLEVIWTAESNNSSAVISSATGPDRPDL